MSAVAGWSLAAGVDERLASAARAAAPREACGLLLGRVVADEVQVLVAFPARNADPRPARFRVHPEDQLAAERRAAAEGLTVLGAWHAHPGGDARPSRADLAGRAYPLVAILALGRDGAADRLVAWWGADGAGARALGAPRRGFGTPPGERRGPGRREDRTNAPSAIP